MTSASPAVLSKVTARVIRTLSLESGTRDGIQVAGLDQRPFALLLIVGFVAESGMWSFDVWIWVHPSSPGGCEPRAEMTMRPTGQTRHGFAA